MQLVPDLLHLNNAGWDAVLTECLGPALDL